MDYIAEAIKKVDARHKPEDNTKPSKEEIEEIVGRNPEEIKS